jgi:undecaprenyl diphosphate synthase
MDTGLHVAIIMDGNGRWASQRGWPRLFGHRRGADRAKQIVEACPGLGVRHVTLYAFSTENWKRSTEEVLGLMSLMSRVIRREADRLAAEGVRMRFIGDRAPLNARLRRLMAWIEQNSKDNTLIDLTLALNYGGRDEITRAVRALAAEVAAGQLRPEAIDEAMISARLDTAGQPDPDLVIRTSGETRISNYLLWQSAYTEYAFTPTLWPDFTVEELAEILEAFRTRERRFGKAPA